MTRLAIRDMAIEEMDRWGLLHEGWRFEFDEAKRRHGCCKPSKKLITLSWHIAKLGREHILDTILHEIAHALEYVRYGRTTGHSDRWKRICREVGATPERLVPPGTPELASPKYTLLCTECPTFYPRHRLKRRIRMGVENGSVTCGNCGGRLTIKQHH